ncbi:MAG: MipA/OmpV family protein [Pseudomonadota bacterium]
MLQHPWLIACFAIASFTVLCAAPAIMHAQEADPVPDRAPDVDQRAPETKNLTIALGAGITPDYEGSEDYEAVPLWLVRYDDLYHPDTYAQLFATTFKSNLLPNKNWRIGPTIEYVGERDDVDNNRVDDLSDASASLLVGGLFGYEEIIEGFGLVGVELDARFDAINNNGYLITPKAIYKAPIAPKLFVDAGIGATYASGDYMSNYFGIDARNARRSGLDEFDADADFKDAALDLSFTYAITDSWRTTLITQYKRLLGDAKDSPITDDEGSANQFFGGLLVGYAF